MLKTSYISLNTSGVLNKLLNDYINKKSSVSDFYTFFPDKDGFKEALRQNPYHQLNRTILVKALEGQANMVANTTAATSNNIRRLAETNSYTVTTGHQLCLFTGPLYFIYKIISVINLAEELKQTFPGNDFVPVYWMASEDHDFEEVSSFNLFGKSIKWESAQTGAVGDFKTEELNTLFGLIEETLGKNEQATYLASLFKQAYLNHSTLSQATRFLVNELFGKYGLVTVDGNDNLLKQQFKTSFRTDIFENVAFTKVSESISKLEELGYNAQVTPRKINCFYTEPGVRGRIEQEGNVFKVVGTDISFTKAEIESLIENNPEKISPNVVLRPLYQQAILPNLSYTGGPGELAYWLQYKSMFNALDVFFPVLCPRAFVTVVDKNLKSKIDKLDFTVNDFFSDEQELIKQFRVKANTVFDLDGEKKEVEKLFAMVAEKVGKIDKTLVSSVMAEQQKSLNSLDIISGKTNKALKQKSDTEINQIKGVKEKLFPGGIPQERFDNFSGFYLKWGVDFIETIKKDLAPLNLQHHIITEE